MHAKANLPQTKAWPPTSDPALTRYKQKPLTLTTSLALLLGFSANIPILQTSVGWTLIGTLICVNALAIHRGRLYIPNSLAIVALYGYLILIGVSWLWSPLPMRSVFYISSFLATSLIGYIIGSSFDIDQIFGITFHILLLIAVISIIIIILFPQFQISPYTTESGWRGWLYHKNLLGKHMALLFTLSVVRLKWRSDRNAVTALSIVLSMVLIVGSSSREGLLSAIVATSFLLLVGKTQRRQPIFYVRTTLLMVAIGSIIAIALPSLASFVLSDPTTLSGRSLIWKAVLASIEARPVLGYGYAGFWNGLDGPSRSVIQAMYDFIPQHAHNMYLEITLSGGLVGLTMFLVFWIGTVATVWTDYSRRPSESLEFGLAIIAIIVAQSIASVPIPGHQNSLWILLIAIAVSLGTPSSYRTDAN